MQRCFASNPVWSSFRRYSTKKPFIHKKFSDYIFLFPSTIRKTTGRSVTIKKLFQSFEIFVVVVRGLYPYCSHRTCPDPVLSVRGNTGTAVFKALLSFSSVNMNDMSTRARAIEKAGQIYKWKAFSHAN